MARHKGYRRQVDEIVSWGFNKGIWQSLIINTAILLLLALIYSDIPKSITTIALTLGTTEPYDDVDLSAPPEIQIESVTKSDNSGDHTDQYMVNDPAEGELVSVNLDIDTPVNVSSVKEFAPTGKQLMESISNSQNYADPWSETTSTGLGKSSRKGSGGTGDGAGGGQPSKIEKRLAKYRAKTGDVQVSISWDNYNDIDLWVAFEGQGYSNNIGWQNRSDIYGGLLDIDCNVNPTTREAVENIFWPIGGAPPGRYTVYVHRFKQWDKAYSTKVDVRILWDGNVINRHINVSHGDMIKVFTFTKKQGSTRVVAKPQTFLDSLMSPMPSYEDVDTGPHLFTGQD